MMPDITFSLATASLLLLSISSGFVMTIFGLLFWGYDPRRQKLSVVLLALFHVALSIPFFYSSKPELFLFINCILYMLLFLGLFRALSWKVRLLAACFATILDFLFHVHLFTLKDTSLAWLLISFVILLVIYCFIIAMRRKRAFPGIRVLHVLKYMHARNIALLITFLLSQGLIMLLFASSVVNFSKDQGRFVSMFLLIVSCALGLSIFFLAIRAIAINREEAVKMTQDHYIEDMSRMFSTIRNQRQDFIHHSHMILALLNENKLEELKQYTDQLVGEIIQVNELLRIGHPAFAALIQAKIVIALNRNIDFQYEFSDLEQIDLGVKSIDLVKMIGNLIDNAFDEVGKQQDEENRWVEVGGWVHLSTLYVTVRNPCKLLSDAEIKQMFTPGFTTKRNGHSGLGLSIVKERIEHYKGSIHVESDLEDGIMFKLSIPVSQKKAII